MSVLAVSLLGSPEVLLDGAPVSVDTRKAIALLAYLAITGRAQRRDRLAALFWPESDQSRARAALRRTLSVLNAALDGGWLIVNRELIELRRSGELFIDVARFRGMVAAARQATDRGQDRLEDAVALFRGAFMEGFYLRDSPEFEDWQYQEGESLRRDLAWALERLASASTGDPHAEIGYALRWLALDPLHEEAHRRLMLLYARAGQTASAVRQYRECVRILEQELGVEPLAATTELYQAIQERREPAAMATNPAAETQSEPVPAATRPPPREYSLVGRERELAMLAAAHDAVEPAGHLVVVEGEPGVGKTRLVEAFLRQIRERGAPTLTLRCYEGEADLTYGPFIDAFKPILRGPRGEQVIGALPGQTLSEVGRLFPELSANRPDVADPAPLDSPGARARFYDAMIDLLHQTIAGERPGALFVDDVQWADGASLDLLAYLAHRLSGRPLVVLAWRADQVPEGHRLRNLLSGAISADAATLISLTRLQHRDVEALAREAAGASRDASELGERLFQETGGLPFFVVQYLNELRSWDQGERDDAWPIPGGVRSLLQARLAALASEEVQMLTTLAAVGSACSFELLVEASGRSEEEAATALERLLARDLVVERQDRMSSRQAPLYEVDHTSLRDLIYEETSLLRRRLLHRRIAMAMRRQPSGWAQSPEIARVASHLRLAGQDEEAARAYREAGEAAASLYANREAVHHYEAALAHGYEDAAAIHEEIGDLQTREGNFELALSAYEKAASLHAPFESGRVEHKLGNVYHRLGEWALAEGHYSATERILKPSNDGAKPDGLARLYVDWGLVAHRQGDRERARRLGERALALASEAGDFRSLSQSHNLLGILARNAGDDAARAHLEESLHLARDLDDFEARAAALNNLALLEYAATNIERAIELGREALALAVLQADRHRQAALHSNLADYLYATGQVQKSMEHLRQSAVIYAEIGVVAGERHAEIWKLAEW